MSCPVKIAVLFERTLEFVSLYTRRRLSQQRVVTMLAIYAAVLGIVISLSYWLTSTFVLYPMANMLFDVAERRASRNVPAPWNEPAGMPSFVYGAAAVNLTAESEQRRKYINYDSLPMRRPEANLIMSYLQPTDTYLEYGASGTTLAFPMLVQQAFVIEHDVQVCNGISSEMEKHPELAKRLRAFCAPVPPGRADWALKSQFEEGSYTAFHNYVDFPRMNLSDVKFDKVLINGRARVACSLRILTQLHGQSLLFFHDYFIRPKHYSSVLDFYEEVARIVVHGPVRGYSDDPMGLLILRPKPEYVDEGLSDISVARVNAIYQTYEDMEPTEKSVTLEAAFETSLLATGDGGYPYDDMMRAQAQDTTRARFLLDLLIIPFIALTYYILRVIFHAFFLEALSLSGSRGSRVSRGDLRTLMPRASLSNATSTKHYEKTLPVTTAKAQ